MIWLLNGSYQFARSDNEAIAIDIPLYGQVTYNDLMAQAELLVGREINHQFSQNPDLATIRVMVTVSRHGEVIPVLTTTVSRSQWQDQPQVSTWTEYYSASYALLQRYEIGDVATVVRVPVSPVTSVQRPTWVDQAYDEGRLTGPEAQEYLADLD